MRWRCLAGILQGAPVMLSVTQCAAALMPLYCIVSHAFQANLQLWRS